ncbi:hypothetical protein KI387_011281, partial [Taxus chinensis]
PTQPPSVMQPPSVPCKWAPQTKTTDRNFILGSEGRISGSTESIGSEKQSPDLHLTEQRRVEIPE